MPQSISRRRLVPAACLRMVIAAAGVTIASAAMAQQPPTAAQVGAIRSACQTDYGKQCHGVPPGGKAALECLQTHLGKVSARCRTAVAAATAPAAAPAHRRRDRRLRPRRRRRSRRPRRSARSGRPARPITASSAGVFRPAGRLRSNACKRISEKCRRDAGPRWRPPPDRQRRLRHRRRDRRLQPRPRRRSRRPRRLARSGRPARPTMASSVGAFRPAERPRSHVCKCISGWCRRAAGPRWRRPPAPQCRRPPARPDRARPPHLRHRRRRILRRANRWRALRRPMPRPRPNRPPRPTRLLRPPWPRVMR